jgi:hypothetical protein
LSLHPRSSVFGAHLWPFLDCLGEPRWLHKEAGIDSKLDWEPIRLAIELPSHFTNASVEIGRSINDLCPASTCRLGHLKAVRLKTMQILHRPLCRNVTNVIWRYNAFVQ